MLKYHIQTVELASAQGAIQFNSIPQDYDDLYVVWSTRYVSEATTKTSILFNNSSSNFSYRLLQGDGSAAAVGTNTLALGGINNGSTTTANTFSNNQMLVSNYKSNIAKSYLVDAVSENNATSSFQDIWTGLWNNSAPITSLTITGSSALAIGSSASLYGVKRGFDGVTLPAAQGGVVTTSGGYTIHTFNSSETFTAFRPLQCEYLVIAGGGGGSGFYGGGGAGGYRSSVAGELSGGNSSAEQILFIPSGTSYPVTVGAGGAGTSTPGASGANSSFGTIASLGGGGGNADGNGILGGSGGAAGSPIFTGGAGTAGQGFAGGIGGSVSGTQSGGGGGGAGQVGANSANPSTAGNGGNGLSSAITGSTIPRAGGGGGGVYSNDVNGTRGTGGSGGGGNGGVKRLSSILQTVTAGTPNTGSGGGAGSDGTGGNGGSGVVIIRYLTP